MEISFSDLELQVGGQSIVQRLAWQSAQNNQNNNCRIVDRIKRKWIGFESESLPVVSEKWKFHSITPPELKLEICQKFHPLP